ncbi:MAG: pilus assembly protein [Arenicella sp.]
MNIVKKTGKIIILFKKCFNHNIAIATFSAVLTFVGSQVAVADDIEIYQNLTGNAQSGSAIENDPNLLFILDNSGSMGGRVPDDPRADYDPNGTYPGNSPAGIYVHETDGDYTGIYIPSNKNYCNAATEFHNDNPTFPVFFGKAQVWEYTTASGGGGTCTPGSSSTTKRFKYKASKPNQFQAGKKPKRNFPINAGVTDFVLQIDNTNANFNLEISAYFRDSNNDVIGSIGDVCSTTIESSNQQKITCGSGVVPVNAAKLTIASNILTSAGPGDDLEFEVTQITACPPAPPSTAASGEWRHAGNPVTTGAFLDGLECQADAGSHGINSGSSEAYITVAPDGTTDFSTAQYTNLEKDALSWDADSLINLQLVTAHYHDYLQEVITDTPDDTGTITSNDEDEILEEAQDLCNDGSSGDLVQVNYTGGSQLFRCRPKIEVLRRSMKTVLGTMNNKNVGIVKFDDSGNFHDGGVVIQGLIPVDGDNGNNRTKLVDTINVFSADTWTPLQESLYEAHAYFAGEKSPVELKNSTNDTDTSILASDNETFISPINNACQANNVILFTDGAPTRDEAFETDIEALNGGAQCTPRDNGSNNGECLDDLAEYMANTTKVNKSVGYNNKVRTHTIAFNIDVPLLQETATKGDGSFETANNTVKLVSAFQSIIEDIQNVESDAFVAPAVTVNSFNRLQSRDDIYFALFEPNSTPRWNGNLKKYKFGYENDKIVITDQNGNVAIDPDTGFFRDNIRSFWSNLNDGESPREGGAAAELKTTRNIYGLLDATASVVQLSDESDDVDTNVTNFISKTDTLSIDLGEKTAVTGNKEEVVKWTLGVDVKDELGDGNTNPNFFLGDTLHSTPYLISFGSSTSNPNDVIFSTTNQGMVHAVDGETGEELWAYVPDPSLFKNLGDYYNNEPTVTEHVYGLDAEIAFDVRRDAKTQKITKANLFVGQRRGGDKYFAMDVLNTDPAASSVPAGGTGTTTSTSTPVESLWTFDGAGVGNGTDRLGQSWATPIPARINYCSTSADSSCAPKDVLIISGGYDEKYDEFENGSGAAVTLSSIASSGVEGNAIFIVDRENGNLLWMAGKSGQVENGSRDFESSEMVHSFPAEPAVIDADFDGVADLLFAVDISGQVWRFDFRGHVIVDGDGNTIVDDNDIRSDNNNGTNAEVTGGIIADLSSDSKNRRFYNRLDVSLTPRIKGDVPANDIPARYNIVVGTGYRASPTHDEGDLNGGQSNRIYAVYDENLQFPKVEPNGTDKFKVSYDYNESGAGSQLDVNDLGEIAETTSLDFYGDHKYGFYLELTKGTSEKLLNPTLTENFKVIAVSYSPTPVVRNSSNQFVCQVDIGSSRAYEIDLINGGFQSVDLNKSGISPRATIVTTKDNNGDTVKGVVIGTELFGTTTDGSGEDLSSDSKFSIANGDPGEISRVNWFEK